MLVKISRTVSWVRPACSKASRTWRVDWPVQTTSPNQVDAWLKAQTWMRGSKAAAMKA